MKKNYFLGIDIGASSGRHIIGYLENGKLNTKEIYRFKNGTVKKNGRLCWDINSLYENVLTGIKKCAEVGMIPQTVGIDTWGVDYVLLDRDGEIIGDAVSYRDRRTDGVRERLFKQFSRREAFAVTGIQPQVFNTVFQLDTVRDELAGADSFLFVPEYLNYALTGTKMTEYTVASTSGLIDCETKEWSYDILNRLKYPARLFGKINMPGTLVGEFSEKIRNEVGFSAKVILTCQHDTASAVMAVPSEKDCAYISSGTWSLLGTELDKPICTTRALDAGFTNEGGYNGKYRFLKNIMGLWMIQSVRNELTADGQEYSFDRLCEMAESETDYNTVIDVNDEMFLSPENMISAISEYCKIHGLPAPENIGQTVKCIYISLAKSYADSVRDLESMTGRTFDTIHIVGGGSRDSYLNRLTAQFSGKTVVSGPSEATAVGNLLVQMIAWREIRAADAKKLILNSFDIERFN